MSLFHAPNISDERPSTGFTGEGSVPQQVTFQGQIRPDALAIQSSFGSLTYAELNQRADQLANTLIALGVKPDILVGLCFQRSPAMLVAALAVLKAGGVYLPLSQSDPVHRLSFMLQDSNTEVLLTTREVRLEDTKGLRRIIYLDELGRMLEPQAVTQTNVLPAITPSNLAYVIYTSGSTGQPKGVEITHRGLSNLVDWHRCTFKVHPDDRATQLARIVFDAAVWEVWPYLTMGASIHLPPEERLNDPEALRDWLVEQRITISFVPTPLAERLLSIRWPEETALRTLLTGGDALHRWPPDDLPFALVNNYGPTECTVVATSCFIRSNGSGNKLPPIGEPITNARLYILDPALRPVAAGTPGELYIGGPGVARGYRNRPELTAEKFVSNPFSADRSERLFKTGDLVQSSANGQTMFLGRLDEQIKVRGFRIEPHEIVAALDSHPEIAQSAVMTQDVPGQDRRLVAYLVQNSGVQLSVSALRDFLSSKLPDYMIPSTFVRLESLPLTSNGKVDRAALPAANEENSLRDEIFDPPETDLEKIVADILGPLLGVKELDVHANFFSLGGHSLLGTQLIARLRDAFGVELPLRSIFEAPTVSGLAVEIDRLLLEKLERMSDAQAESLLNARQSAYA
jgi:amino acid adenylation domain-containing protein